jgi:hypothetical protein
MFNTAAGLSVSGGGQDEGGAGAEAAVEGGKKLSRADQRRAKKGKLS